MIRTVLTALLWAWYTKSCPARGYVGDGPDRDLAEVQKMKGVEVQIDEVKGSGDSSITYFTYEGPGIHLTPVVQFNFKFLAQNDLLGHGPLRAIDEENRRAAGNSVHRGLEIPLWAVVLCARDKDERTLSVTPLQIQEDRLGVEEGKQGPASVHFAISKDLLDHSLLRIVEFNGVARQATDLYLGQKAKPGAPRSWVDPKTNSPVQAPTKAQQSSGAPPPIPGLPRPAGK